MVNLPNNINIKLIGSLTNRLYKYFLFIFLTSCHSLSHNEYTKIYEGSISSNFIFLESTIKGNKYSLLLNTKAGTSVLDTSIVNRYGLKSNQNITLQTSKLNEIRKELYYVPKIYVGKASFNLEDPIPSLDFSIFSTKFNIKFGGVIGLDIIPHLIWKIDNKAKRVGIYSQDYTYNNDLYICNKYYRDDLGIYTMQGIANKIKFYLSTGAESSSITKEDLSNFNFYYIKDNYHYKDFLGENYYRKKLNIKHFNFYEKTFQEIDFIEDEQNILGVNFIKLFDIFIIDTKKELLCYK